MTSASLAGAPKVLMHHLLAIVVLSILKTQIPGKTEDSQQSKLKLVIGYIQNADATGPYAVGWGTSIGSSVEVGDRIAYNGSVWQQLPPPNVPYADDALDDVPSPDTRLGGIVKLAAVRSSY